MLLTAYADTEAAIAAINDVGDQPLPAEAVGSAGAEVVSGPRRSAGGVVGARARAVRWHPRRRFALVAAELRGARFPCAQPGAVPMGRSRHRRADARARQDPGRRPAEAAGRAVPGRHARSSRRRQPIWPQESACTRPRDTALLRPRDHRRRSGGAGERRVCELRRDCKTMLDRAERAGRPGGHELADRELPRLPGRRDRRRPRAARRPHRRDASARNCVVGARGGVVRREDPYRIVHLSTARNFAVTRS